MNKINKIKRLTEEIRKGFWNIEKIKCPNKDLRKFYENNINLWIENAIKLRAEFPKETNIFLANIYRSNFTFKFIIENVAVVNKKTFSLSEKVQFLTDVFENSYHYFGFLTICSNYSKKYTKSLYKKWYAPDSSKEYIKRKIDKPWLNEKGERISGKKWALLNCPLSKFSRTNLDILQLLKNSESHKKLSVQKTEVIIFSSKQPLHFTPNEINELFNYVRYSVSLALHFNIMLAIKYHFWIIPTLIITNQSKFNLHLPIAPKFSQNETITKKGKKKIKENKLESRIEYFIALGYNLLNFLFKEIWEDILTSEPAINNFLRFYNLKFDRAKFLDFQKDAIFESVKLLISSFDHIKKNILKEEFEEPSFSVTLENINQFDYTTFVDEAQNIIIRVKNQDSQAKFDLLLYFMVPGFLSLLSPLSKLGESFNQVIIEEECSY